MIPTYIVDDVGSDRYIARRRLQKAGRFAPLNEATDGLNFLATFFSDDSLPTDSGIPPLILMDINMPELNGFETLNAMKIRLSKGTSARPVVAMFSSSDNERDIQRSAATGVVEHYFTKPINDEAIQTILETFRARGFAV
ncbi:response regulator [Pseudooceanicola algae]|uniref:Uncharacterized protein n=1 Tax=Pseudooceanicola algae TaxID=1537215 RepID=A0A418SCI7_9RHOB|nr:response regulator [Pseudooceanicola algae]QPM90033.1 hypothetical protein PSAL_012650 [Pseudooceanicola algae]